MYTVWNRMYTGSSVEGAYTEFYTYGRIPYISVYMSVYIMDTIWNRMYTGRSLKGMCTEFYSCGRIRSMSGHMSVNYMYTGRIKGCTECGVYGMCTEYEYLQKENDTWISAAMKLVFWTSWIVAGLMGIQILASNWYENSYLLLVILSPVYSTFTNKKLLNYLMMSIWWKLFHAF